MHGNFQNDRRVEIITSSITAMAASVATAISAIELTLKSLDSVNDQIAVPIMPKGSISAIHAAITATTTGTEINTVGYNGLLIDYDVTNIGTGSWAIKVTGAVSAAGSYRDVYYVEGGQEYQMATTVTAAQSRIITFKGIPDYCKIVSTRTVSGTLSLTAQPVHL
jgi:hypothetical protein